MGYGKIVSENIVIDDVALVAGLEVNLFSVSQFADSAGLEVNLLSVSQFADKGFEVLFNKEECTFISKKTGEVALKGAKKGSLFIADLDSTNKDGICCFYTKVKKELVRDMPKLEFAQVEVCEGYSLERTAYKVYLIDQKKIMKSTYMTFDDDKCPGLECLDKNEAEALVFENLNIDSDSDEEEEVDAQQMINEETTEHENHGNGSSSQTPEFDSTNSGGEREERSSSPTNNEENDEGTSQQTHTRKWDMSHTREAIIGDPTAGVRTRSANANECLHACFLSQIEHNKTEEALMILIGYLQYKRSLISLKGKKFGS
ncbi:hypothetical protein AgCh_022453 [Apium graveolens]